MFTSLTTVETFHSLIFQLFLTSTIYLKWSTRFCHIVFFVFVYSSVSLARNLYLILVFLKLQCVSRIVAFVIKIINMIILFEYLVGWLDSSSVEIKKRLGTIFKKTSWAYALVDVNTGMGWHQNQHSHVSACWVRSRAHAHALTRATILGTLCGTKVKLPCLTACRFLFQLDLFEFLDIPLLPLRSCCSCIPIRDVSRGTSDTKVDWNNHLLHWQYIAQNITIILYTVLFYCHNSLNK